MMQLIAKLIFVAVAFAAVGVVIQLLARVYRLLNPPRTYHPPSHEPSENQKQITWR